MEAISRSPAVSRIVPRGSSKEILGDRLMRTFRSGFVRFIDLYRGYMHRCIDRGAPEKALNVLSKTIYLAYRLNPKSDPQVLRRQVIWGRTLKSVFLRIYREHSPELTKTIIDFLVANLAKELTKGVKGLDQQKISPFNMVVDFTNRCNLNCYGCYANSTGQGKDLDFDTVDRIVEEAKNTIGVLFLTLTGGEPFLRKKDIYRLAEKHPDLYFMVYTNGTLIKDDDVKRLGEIKRIFPTISVEGLEDQTDLRRGKGHYQRMKELMRKLKENDVFFGFSVTVLKTNADMILKPQFLQEQSDNGCMFGWYFIYVPIGRKPAPELMVTAEQRELMLNEINRYRLEQGDMFISDFWQDAPLVGGCIAGARNFFHIDGEGEIKPCVFCFKSAANIHDVLAGKSNYKSLADVVANSPLFVGYRQNQREITDPRRPCPIIDNPEKLRKIAHYGNDTQSTPPGFFSGEIAEVINERARDWKNKCEEIPYIHPFDKLPI
jgi:MoaA/NifB/PqqE/SkfB family radical SAM enzyme